MNKISEDIEQLSPLQRSVLVIEELKSKLNALKYANTEPIAIIGMGCRFPGGANDPQKFWQLLSDGVDAITKIPEGRWDVNAYYDPNPDTPGKMYTHSGGFLQQVDQFDPQFFGISPREAISMDPQHRLLLEVSWEALENAGQVPERAASNPTGVFVGITLNDYNSIVNRSHSNSNVETYGITGLPLNAAAGRISYTLGLTGPSMAIDTACSSSLVAIHQACQSLRLRECQMALAGGVNLILLPDSMIATSKARILSPDGHCNTFDAAANGIGRGEGCGMLVLKRLCDAVTAGDNILALIRGSAVNQDGPSSGFTVPNASSQQAVIRQALAMAKVEPSQVSYVEAHGTGTSLGDPIEVRALGTVFAEGHSPEHPLMIGSVKTNIGHLESAAGVSGLIKVVLQLQHQQIVPHLHLKHPTPHINWDELPLTVPTKQTPWQVKGKERIAGVSSFGASGTNAHVILGEAPVREPVPVTVDRSAHLLTLSAKTEAALEQLATRYQNHLATNPNLALGDICFTANTGRSHFNHRLAIVAESTEQLREQLQAFATGTLDTRLIRGQLTERKRQKIAFLFTGQGSQYVNMGRQLYKTQPVFRRTLDQCEQILQSYLEKPLLDVLYPEDSQELNSSVIDQTAYTQPILFAIQYALAQLWQSWGIEADVVMGHSVGEYAAAAIAGVFSLEDGLKLIAHRGRLMQQLPSRGEMVAVMASEEQVNQLIAPYTKKVAIAAINGLESVVISGEAEAIRTLSNSLKSQGIRTKQLQVSHAFHSPLMEPILAEFEAVANQIIYHQPRILLVSNITKKQADDSVTTANYWVNHVCQPVKFAQSMKTLHQEGCEVFLEIGPKPILLDMGRQCLPEGVGVWLPSLRSSQEDWQQMLHSLAELYVQGVKVDWLEFDRDYTRSKVVLPTYSFQRQRYWIDKKEHPQARSLSLENVLTKTINHVGKDIVQHLEQQELIKEKDNYLLTKKTGEISLRRDRIIQELCSQFSQVLGFDNPSEVDIHNNLLEIGADSLILMEVGGKVEKIYGINIPIRKFFKDLTTLDALGAYIDQNLPQEWATQSEPENTSQQFAQIQRELNSIKPGIDEKVPETALERIMQQQIQVMSDIISKQLEVLQHKATSAKHISSWENQEPQSALATSLTVDSAERIPQHRKLDAESSSPAVEFNQTLNTEQQNYLKEFLAIYTKKTQKSKQRALACRPVLADKRAAVGFRIELKEMKYPIIGESSSGSRIWDIDDNEYIDVSMGFGIHLFGHQPQFIIEALQHQLNQGMQIGPQAQLAGEVAQLVHELTGMERVTFCNSGTEAVMTALRLARLATGRDKVVIFSGAYHGQFDGTLAVTLTNSTDENFKAAPMFPGVLQNMVDDVMVLTYGEVKSLDIIKAHAQELAAVLVEPVQSRRPDLQPKEFLQQLRQLTQEVGIPLIFDEIITGFRIHPGGAQAWFGIEADIATYGKCVGGGIPIGILAGKAAYIDGIDGGQWNYGDSSYPQKLQTFFGGTFNKNPLSMAAARAVLKHLKSQGAVLQQNLNQRTSKLITALNAYFEQEYVPIKMVNFGSMFRFVPSGNYSYLSQPIGLDILFYKLIEKGVYMWEGRNGPACFLSTAHTDEDIDYIISAVKESISEMHQGGFFQKNNQQIEQIDVKKTERVRGVL
ncbi:amino acid adenylation domain-containing protein [Kalymmatonema gypsitolerans NIES-4073]|nr:amino acid adenylation domain-containing protein [Scytonema sp. NIES-4073]